MRFALEDYTQQALNTQNTSASRLAKRSKLSKSLISAETAVMGRFRTPVNKDPTLTDVTV